MCLSEQFLGSSGKRVDESSGGVAVVRVLVEAVALGDVYNWGK